MSDGAGYLKEIKKKLGEGQRQWKRSGKVVQAHEV